MCDFKHLPFCALLQVYKMMKTINVCVFNTACFMHGHISASVNVQNVKTKFKIG